MNTSTSRVLSINRNRHGLSQRPDGLWEFRAETIDQHIDAFLSIEKNADSTRWGMAAIAASIETKYGESRFEEFAQRVNYTPRHVRRIARVYRAANEIGHYCPDLTFQHHIEALSHSDPNEALLRAHANGLSSITLAKWIKEQTQGEADDSPRERFSERHQTEGEQLAEILRQQVEAFPQFAGELNECIERIRARTERTRATDKKTVLSILKDWGALTMRELIEETRLSHWDLRQVLATLIESGQVVETRPRVPRMPPASWPSVYQLKR